METNDPKVELPISLWHRRDVQDILAIASKQLLECGVLTRVEGIALPSPVGAKAGLVLTLGEDMDTMARAAALVFAGGSEVLNEGRVDYENEVAHWTTDLLFRSEVHGAELTREEWEEVWGITRIERETLHKDESGELRLSGDLPD